ncbi:Ger(x)C family spore germination protein [Paenibacillus sp. GD4]|uniref:Ger(x)C family spore germination protein n=1 Tax=Paenibacillus sp. GD4 TaxID=3068890 RepID=UPI002796875B|nr:Ger(x)C family spore germination protein [Paenibacillus sp. GD4]MDQ1910589.1 Ger(x)C family spore germination protein [Paenibacillus sp. GD4]
MNRSKGIRLLNAALAIALAALLLSGCWDRQEIEERAVVLGIGIDKASEEDMKKESEISHMKGRFGAPEAKPIRVTIQIAVPGRIPLGPGSGGEGGKGGGQNTVWVVEGRGHTLNDALNNLQQRVSPPLFYGHLRIIVVSESVAREGIENLNDFLRRNPEIRRMNWMFISQDKASDLMRAAPQLERVPTLYLMNTMDQSVKMGRFPDDFLGIFWSNSSAKGQEGYLPYIRLRSEDTVEIAGLAFFRGDRMVGHTTPLEIPLFMGIKGMNPAGGQVYVKLENTSEYYMFGGRSRKSFIRAELRDGKPHISIRILVEGNIIEKSSDVGTLTTEQIDEIESKLSKEAAKAYSDLIKKTQAQRSDIFGFGEHVRAKKPDYWNRQVKTKETWQEMYETLSFEITAEMHIRRIGMKAK